MDQERTDAGFEYDFWDEDVSRIKMAAMVRCGRLNALHAQDESAVPGAMRELLGSIGEGGWIGPNFQCDNGKNIHIGTDFIANCNVVMLDMAEIRIGDHCLIGPNTMITTVNHPLSPQGRRNHIGIAKPVTIGNDVWMGGNCTILPGVTIGNNVVVAAGAVVTKDVPDNCLVGGCPARVLKTLEDDLEH